MKNIKIFILAIVVIVLVSVLFVFNGKNEKAEKVFEEYKTVEEKVEYQLNKLSLNEKIAQMLIVSYNNDVVDDNLKSILENNKPGGFILFNNNITDYDKTIKFVNDIKNTSDIPMFIAIDQEGGSVQKFNSLKDYDVTQIPSMKELGKKNDSHIAYEVGTVIAEELRVIGVNVNFAPVIDVIENENDSYIGDRSLSFDKDIVSKLGISLAHGMYDKGIIPVFKHFPGHGSTKDDSHYYLPVITKSKEELINTDLVPFINAINDGAKMIMIGHLAIPKIDGKTPASLSKVLINDLLKDELKYNGLVITDALNMKALTDNYTEQEIYEKTINAGVDILLMPKSSSSAIKLINDSIKNKKITEDRIDESVRKILTLKYENLWNYKTLDKSFYI